MFDKRINEIIIIADYDGGYCLSVWYKGQNDIDNATARDIHDLYDSYHGERSIQRIQDKYKCDVLLCCDGWIEYFENPIDTNSLL